VSRDAWNRHPAELEGVEFEDWMLWEMIALRLLEIEENRR
jgi:hypothetical protein